MKKQRLVYTLICISLAVAVFFTVFEGDVAASSVGDNAPLFTLKNLDGKEVSLATYKGKPVFLNFWATWCPYCRKERKELAAVYEAYNDKDLVIISVSLDRSENKLRTYMKDHPAEYIVLTDTKMMSGALYGVRGFPTTFLVDRDGIVKHKFTGAREWSSMVMKDVLDKLIK